MDSAKILQDPKKREEWRRRVRAAYDEYLKSLARQKGTSKVAWASMQTTNSSLKLKVAELQQIELKHMLFEDLICSAIEKEPEEEGLKQEMVKMGSRNVRGHMERLAYEDFDLFSQFAEKYGIHKTSKTRINWRALIIRGMKEGRTVQEMADLVGVDRVTVTTNIRKLEKEEQNEQGELIPVTPMYREYARHGRGGIHNRMPEKLKDRIMQLEDDDITTEKGTRYERVKFFIETGLSYGKVAKEFGVSKTAIIKDVEVLIKSQIDFFSGQYIGVTEDEKMQGN